MGHHLGCGGIRHHRQCESKDPGQGGHPSGPAALDLRRQAARRWSDLVRLQHPEGVHFALGAAPARWWCLMDLIEAFILALLPRESLGWLMGGASRAPSSMELLAVYSIWQSRQCKS